MNLTKSNYYCYNTPSISAYFCSLCDFDVVLCDPVCDRIPYSASLHNARYKKGESNNRSSHLVIKSSVASCFHGKRARKIWTKANYFLIRMNVSSFNWNSSYYGYRQVWLIWNMDKSTVTFTVLNKLTLHTFKRQFQQLRLLSVSSYVWAENKTGKKSQPKHS